MATTLKQFISNISSQLKQSGDDKDIKKPQIALWTSFFINKYRYAKGNKLDSGAYLSIFSDVPVVKPTYTVSGTTVKDRKYIDLPATIYDYDKDGGIDYLSYTDFDDTCMPSFAGVTFSRTTPSKSRRLYMSVYEKPSPNNPYFYRNKNRLNLLGIESIEVPYLEIGIITAFDPFAVGALDEELDIGEEAIADITKQVLDLGRFMMLIPQDNTNDSTDTSTNSTVPTTKIVSVNESAAPTQQE